MKTLKILIWLFPVGTFENKKQSENKGGLFVIKSENRK